MTSSRLDAVSTVSVMSCILARPFSNLFEISLELVYGSLFVVVLVGSLLPLITRAPVSNSKVELQSGGWAALYLVYLSLLLLRDMVDSDNFGVTLQGFVALSLPVLIYLMARHSKPEARQHALQIFIGPLLGLSAIASILYFFFDFTFWGMIQHHVYTGLIYSNMAVDRRAIGLFASPQSHALSMLVLLVIVISGRQFRPSLSIVLGMLAIFAGILSGSKAFLLGVLLIGFVRLPRSIVLLGMLPLLVAGWFAAELLNYSDLRILSLFNAAKYIGDYTAYPLWLASLSSLGQFQNIFAGQGLGTMGSQSEILQTFVLEYSSTESYLLQIAIEGGLFGLFLFIMLLISAFKASVLAGKPALSPALFLAVFANAVFTPAFYGIGNAALLGLLLAHTRRTK
jgi:hypothetical protein